MTERSWNPDLFESITELVAKRLASFRLGIDVDDPYDYNKNDLLEAGIIVGSLWSEGFLTDRIHGELVAPKKEGQ